MLSQELRPNTWSEVAGQKENIRILRAVIKNPTEAPKSLIFQGEFGSGKCVEENTRVMTSLGYIPIKDIVPSSEAHFDSEGFMDISDRNIVVRGGYKASHLYFGGLKDTIKVSTRSIDIEGTPNHRVKVLTDNGIEWVYLRDIREGDNICVDITQRKEEFAFDYKTEDIPYFKANDSEFEKGYFLGAILGDGNVEIGTNRSIFMGTLEDCTAFSDRLENFDDPSMIKVVISQCKDPDKDLYYLNFTSPKLHKWLENHGMCGDSHDRTIPEWFFRTNKGFLSGVLSGLYDTDGSVGGIDFQVISEGLAKGFKDILLLFGITSFMTSKRTSDKAYVGGVNKKNHHAYRVQVYGKDNFVEAAKVFKLRESYKMVPIMEYAAYEADHNTTHNNRDNIPRTAYVEKKIEELYNTIKSQFVGDRPVKGTGWKAWYNSHKEFSIFGNTNQKNTTKLSWYNAKKALPNGEDSFHSELDDILDEYKFEPVRKVEESRSVVYDLTVPESHTFMANGVVNHNTTSARILAKELNNIKDPNFDLLSSPFYYEFDSTVVGNVEEIRNLRDMFAMSYGEYWRVIVFDEVHAVSTAAQTALLKILEEAEGRNIFILCTTHIHKVLPTIRSRSLELKFECVPEDEIIKNLTRVSEERGIALSDEVKLLIADRSGGHMRNAHMLLDKYNLLGEEDFKDSIKSSITLYCDFLIAAYKGDKDAVLKTINELLNIPKDDLQSDFNTVMTESMRGYCGFEIRHMDIKRLVDIYKQDFALIVNFYMSPWIKNAFLDMPYFQATFLSMYQKIRDAMDKRQAVSSQATAPAQGFVASRNSVYGKR
jgi:DNA polymerase III delta prime subunit